MVAGARLSCETCHKRFTRPPGSSRLNCEKCRPTRARGKAGLAKSTSVVVEAGADVVRLPGLMEQAVLAELREYGREGSVSGVAALLMARQADQGVNTGSQLAMLLDKVQGSVEKAIKGVPPKGDELNELQQEWAADLAALAADQGPGRAHG